MKNGEKLYAGSSLDSIKKLGEKLKLLQRVTDDHLDAVHYEAVVHVVSQIVNTRMSRTHQSCFTQRCPCVISVWKTLAS